jgi:hypothetical protein
MRIPLSVLIVCVISANARAEPPALTAPSPATPVASDASPPRLGFGLSSPAGWLIGTFGVSWYVRIGEHFAVRANLAATKGGIGYFLLGEDGSWGNTDYGISGVWYPQRIWDGPLIEAGALLRDRYHETSDTVEEVTTRSMTYAGRALIGWSWLIRSNVFIALAAGGSWGRESGETTTVHEFRDEPMTTPVRGKRLELESYLRFGVVFGSRPRAK